MAPVIPNSTNSISITPVITSITNKTSSLSQCSFTKNLNKQKLPASKYTSPLSTSVRLFPHFRFGSNLLKPKLQTHLVFATGTDVAVEETNVSVSETKEDAESPPVQSEASPPTTQSKRPRVVRKSDMPPVKNEELIPGASFTGKVKSVQPFGAFVDFGAFTDGLVHVSKLSDGYVKDVSTIVSVGQEVKVWVVEANMETGRISLTMRESDDPTKVQQTDEKPRPSPRKSTGPRTNQKRDDSKKSKFVKGQDLEGTVKNLVRAGAFISLPEGEEGFLPTSEEIDEGLGHIMGGSSLEAGQEVSVRVLRIARGQVTLTMKKEEDSAKLDSKLTGGIVHTATNPFLLAFRGNKEISAFLDESKKNDESIEDKKEEVQGIEAAASVVVSDDVIEKEADVAIINEGEPELAEEVADQTVLSESGEEVVEAEADVAIINEGEPELSEEVADQTILAESGEEVVEKEADVAILNEGESVVSEEVANQVSLSESGEEAIEGEADVAILNEAESELSEEITNETVLSETVEEVVEKIADDVTESSEEKETSATISEDGGSNGSSSAEVDSPVIETATTDLNIAAATATIPPALVKQLREESGAGMMDCKKALSETGGDIVKAQEYLRKKGLASADKKSSRATAEGRVGSYIHDSRIGVLIEVNCETDFVARGDIFKELVQDLAMQVAACPQVKYLNTEDFPKEIMDKEREIEMQKEDLLSKPEQIREKIVEGRLKKSVEEVCLMEQPFIRDDKVAVKDWVKQTISTVGENIKVKRFVRFNLGEGLEKKSTDFAAEVAAQTAARAAAAPPAAPVEQEAAVAAETEEAVEKPTKAPVSAALVKQLREETGAGMMDCKKALSETGGDIVKAQEYLRKKGLSSADKKSSRLAAEGRIGTYIHDSRIGVLIEVNCETDFVGRSQNFKELVDDIAMQVAACPQVQYVSIEDIPESSIEREKQLEMQREDLQSKPENIREKIVEGRIAKRLGEIALLEQPFIKDDGLSVKDLVKQTVASLGENIKVRRFVRFTLGE
ncbi:hypothetical protein ABFS82_11G050600 [Erythranthe guttata]